MDKRKLYRLIGEGLPGLKRNNHGIWLPGEGPILRGFTLSISRYSIYLFRFYAVVEPLYVYKGFISISYALELDLDDNRMIGSDEMLMPAIQDLQRKALGPGMNHLEIGANVSPFADWIMADPTNKKNPLHLRNAAYGYILANRHSEAEPILASIANYRFAHESKWDDEFRADVQRVLAVLRAGDDPAPILNENTARSRQALRLP